MDARTDNLLTQEVREGGAGKLAILFERHHLRLLPYFVRLTGSRDLGDDLDNVMSIGTGSFGHDTDLALQVPLNTSLILKCVNGGDIRVENVSGEIYIDFDVRLNRIPPAQAQTGEPAGRHRLQFDKVLYGTVNGGGPEPQFTTFSGRIYIRKKK